MIRKQLLEEIKDKKTRISILTNELLEKKAVIRNAESRCALLDLDIKSLWADILKLEEELEKYKEPNGKENQNEKRK